MRKDALRRHQNERGWQVSTKRPGKVAHSGTSGRKQAAVRPTPGIEKTPGVCGGDPCIRQTRIPVWLLEQLRRLGR